MTRSLIKTTYAAIAFATVALVGVGATLGTSATADADALGAPVQAEVYASADATCLLSTGGGQHSGTGNCEYPW